MNDIQTRADLQFLMEVFYTDLLRDDSISYIFTDVAGIDIKSHLPHIVNFWEQNILGTGNYRKNVLKIHAELNDLEKLTSAHFKTWLTHFNTAVDSYFAGENAENIKTRALSIATVMQIRLG
jgi:hemoglobin